MEARQVHAFKDGPSGRQVVDAPRQLVSVLVLALQSDLHADVVVDAVVTSGVRVVRVDPTEASGIPSQIRLGNAPLTGRMRFRDEAPLDMAGVRGVLCRFAVDALVPAATASPLERFAQAEHLSAFQAGLRAIPRERWINDPWREAHADCRIHQARLAAAVGLTVPPFVVSTDYDDLCAFAAHHGDCVIKPLSDSPLARVDGRFVAPEHLHTADFVAPYAAAFAPLSEGARRSVDGTPSLLQARVDKIADVRATVVDDDVYAGIMYRMAGDPVDIRQKRDPGVQSLQLPVAVADQLVTLVRRLEVRFASCDLVMDASGAYHFLEANVAGNWLWAEPPDRMPVADRLAAALVRGGPPAHAGPA